MRARSRKTPRAFEIILEYKSFLSILRYYADLNCFVIPSEPGNAEWLAVHYHQRAASLFDFEKKYNFKFNWDKILDLDYEMTLGKGRPLLLETLGFYDIFMPIRRRGKRLGTIFSGGFRRPGSDLPSVAGELGRLTGQSASSENGEFRQFVRVMLETPVLEGSVLIALPGSLGVVRGCFDRSKQARSLSAVGRNY